MRTAVFRGRFQPTERSAAFERIYMKTGIVMEGGAMRGMFTAGVIDVLMEHDISFDGGVGVSAGAAFGCNLKSRQHGRVIRYNLKYCRDWRFASMRSLITTGTLYGAEFCYTEIPYKLDLFDIPAYRANPMEFYCGCTDMETGKAVFRHLKKGDGEDLYWFMASASMPIVSEPVKIRHWKLLDGGISDSIPLRFLEEKGYDRNLVVLTQPYNFVKKPNKALPLIRRVYKDYPALINAVATRHMRYNRERAYIKSRAASGDAFIICPPEPLRIGSTEHDPRELIRVYDIGRQTMLEELPALREFFNK